MARPCKLDDLTAQRLVAAVEKGLPRDTAAKLARIHPATFFEWLKRGRNGEPGFVEFHDRVKEAEAKGEEELVAAIRSAGKNSWQANAWLLERRRPQVWGLRKYEQPEARPGGTLATSPAENLSIAESVVAAYRSAV